MRARSMFASHVRHHLCDIHRAYLLIVATSMFANFIRTEVYVIFGHELNIRGVSIVSVVRNLRSISQAHTHILVRWDHGNILPPFMIDIQWKDSWLWQMLMFAFGQDVVSALSNHPSKPPRIQCPLVKYKPYHHGYRLRIVIHVHVQDA